MIIGFTGTRQDMSNEQKRKVKELCEQMNLEESHHGGCHGADETFHNICVQLKEELPIVIHPGDDNQAGQNWRGEDVTILDVKSYLARNKDIVNESDIMIATPKGDEEMRSGTWSTIRYAKKINKPIYIVFPDGKIER